MTRREQGILILWFLVWVTEHLVVSLMDIGKKGGEVSFTKKVLEVSSK